MRVLSTTSEVIAALGGAPRLAGRLGAATGTPVAVKTVYHWSRDSETIPAKYRDLMAEWLRDVRCSAPRSLWGMLDPIASDVA